MNLLAAKIYYDGSNWIAIPHTERPYRQRRRRKQPEKSEELQQLLVCGRRVKIGALAPCRYSRPLGLSKAPTLVGDICFMKSTEKVFLGGRKVPKRVHNMLYNTLEINKREVCYECIRQSNRL